MEKLTKRETTTIKRIESALKSAQILEKYFVSGFTSFEAMKAIVIFYKPDIDLKRLGDFWHFRVVDEDIADSLTEVLNKIKP